jgi:hypothetical protein
MMGFDELEDFFPGDQGCEQAAHKVTGENGIQPGYLIGKPGSEEKVSRLSDVLISLARAWSRFFAFKIYSCILAI